MFPQVWYSPAPEKRTPRKSEDADKPEVNGGSVLSKDVQRRVHLTAAFTAGDEMAAQE